MIVYVVAKKTGSRWDRQFHPTRYMAVCRVAYAEMSPNGRWESVDDGLYFIKGTRRITWQGWV